MVHSKNTTAKRSTVFWLGFWVSFHALKQDNAMQCNVLQRMQIVLQRYTTLLALPTLRVNWSIITFVAASLFTQICKKGSKNTCHSTSMQNVTVVTVMTFCV